MKLGIVIGRITLSQAPDLLQGGRFLIVSPLGRAQLAKGLSHAGGMGDGMSLVVYDDLGGGVGDVIAYEEGAEAAQPFAVPPPIDAINCALVDRINYHPRPK